eukprot:gnl/TRDRNA2_/TRDRNA2_71232_c0_seq1.p2 gnl/TRDRNA2_/TRDRNA2_71232_c0~~gnl/TRDRNA2_/TRDRNA2_71232_c0_seq1.p2  ORF type:complete len:136 (+),score=11.58 gnl/TRDRNA2_/TRDRNA2_71232_c0_seq1:139-546(+)
MGELTGPSPTSPIKKFGVCNSTSRASSSASVMVVDDETRLAYHVRSGPLPAETALDYPMFLPNTDTPAKRASVFRLASHCCVPLHPKWVPASGRDDTCREQLMFALRDASHKVLVRTLQSPEIARVRSPRSVRRW